MKIINSSKQTVGLLLRSKQGFKQILLMAEDYIIVDEITQQMYNLADPSRKILTIKKEEEE